MGREANCTAELGSARSEGKALLETSELVFRGKFRVVVPLKEITALKIDGPKLFISWDKSILMLELGAAAAEIWADKIRNPPSRLDKLGVKPEQRVTVVGQVDAAFLRELEQRGARLQKTAKPPVDILFYAADTRAKLGRLPALVKQIADDGALWILRPKGSADISEREVMAAGKAAGLVDVKVAAFSPTHTAEKFVIPLARRAKRPKSPKTPKRRKA